MPNIEIHLFLHKTYDDSTQYILTKVDITKPVLNQKNVEKFYEAFDEIKTYLDDQNTTFLHKLEDIKKIESKLSRVPSWILKMFGVK